MGDEVHGARRRLRPLLQTWDAFEIPVDLRGVSAIDGSVQRAFVDRGSPIQKSDVGNLERL
jgi:hypothetical protein